MPIIETEQQTNQNVISGQEYLDAGATRELAGQLQGYAIGYDEGYDAGVAAGGGGSGGSGSGGSRTLYAWCGSDNGGLGDATIYTDFDVAPSSLDVSQTDILYGEAYASTDAEDNVYGYLEKLVKGKYAEFLIYIDHIAYTTYEKVSNTSFKLHSVVQGNLYLDVFRNPNRDVTL